MRHYCKLLLDKVTGEIQHITSSTEPLPDPGGAEPGITHDEIIAVLGDPADGLPTRRSGHFLDTLQGNPAKVITHRSGIPIPGRPTITVGQDALDIIAARKAATGRP